MTRSKKFIAAAVGAALCAGAAWHLTTLHGHGHTHGYGLSAEIPGSLATPAAFPGNATPESAIQSLAWAAGRGDFTWLQEGVTPEVQQMLHEKHGANAETHALRVATQLGNAKIIKKETLSGEQVLLYLQTEGKEGPWKVQMRKSDNKWKLAGISF